MSASLYRAHSLIESFHGLDRAEVFWIPLRAERLRSGPISSLVAGYDTFSASEISLVKGYLDEFFTLSEANCLKRSLSDRQGYPLELEEHSLPLSCRDSSGQALKPLRILPESTWRGSRIIPHRGGLELPFDVLALWRDAPLPIAKEDENDDES